MEFNIQEFIEKPLLATLTVSHVKKDDWIGLAQKYKIAYSASQTKSQIKKKVIDYLVTEDLLPKEAYALCSEEGSASLLMLKKLELEDKAKQREHEVQQREYETQQREKQAQIEIEERERQREHELKVLQLKASTEKSGKSVADFGSTLKFMPKFDETDVENFFILFERTAIQLGWHQEQWGFFAQTAFIGKAKLIYSNLTNADDLTYANLKEIILEAYDQVPETHRQRFRNLNKQEKQTYLEFIKEKERFFDAWLRSGKVTTFEELRQLILVEEILRKVPYQLKLYLIEREVKDVNKAAKLAETYRLTHGNSSFRSSPRSPGPSRQSNPCKVGGSTHSGGGSGSGGSQPSRVNYGTTVTGKAYLQPSKLDSSNLTCAYCKKVGHHIRDCRTLKSKEQFKGRSEPVMTTSTTPYNLPNLSNSTRETNIVNNPGSLKSANTVLNACPNNSTNAYEIQPCTTQSSSSDQFQPFRSYGTVSSSDTSPQHPIQILRDTGASHSLMLRDVIPNIEDSYLAQSVLIQGVGGCITVPLARVYLDTELAKGYFTVGVQDYLPVTDVNFLMGNDIAGGKVIPDPIITPFPSTNNNTKELEDEYPHLFPSCVVTRGMSTQNDNASPCSNESDDNADLDLTNLFPENDQSQESPEEISNLPIDVDTLKEAQVQDPELASFFDRSVEDSELYKFPICFYLKNGILMRKYRPPNVSANEEWQECHQVVIPRKFRPFIISVAHDLSGGHLGIKKTYAKVSKDFFWPKMKSTIAYYCKTCHECQMAGKPNQPIKPAPLNPIPVNDEPFSRVIIDCVGPLPKTRSGNEYLLTVMCATTRYPEAFPLRKITSQNIVKVLTKFFTQYGIPYAVQSDLGSNFTSNLFKQTMDELGVRQYHSTAYRPESQGALERFHQTLKSMLTKYCEENHKEWDEGIHLVLYAVRSSKQESLGFSPFELVYGHEVRGPLKVLKETWMDKDKVNKSLLTHVHQFKTRLQNAVKHALDNLNDSQITMKENFDKKTEIREINPGDLVLAFLPIPKKPLQSKFHGPYLVKEKVSNVNYIIKTPDRRKAERLIHVNLLKLYSVRNPDSENVVTLVDKPKINESEENHLTTDVTLHNSDVLANTDLKFQHLPSNQRKDLECLLTEFPQLFSDVPQQSSLVEHDLVLVDGARPIKQHPYRASPWKREALQKEVQYLIDHGLAEKSDSEWASPCLLVDKPDGSYRMCTDYRLVNQVTRLDGYPLPRIDDIIDQLGDANYITKIDLLRGYYQVRLTERAKKISAFVTPDGLFQYTVLPFGMVNAPATFQRLMHQVTEGLSGVQSYLDDLVIYSRTWDEHRQQLFALFQNLSKAQLTINLNKSEFGQAKLIFLGHVVGQGDVSPVSAKVEAIMSLPVPKDRKALMRFLGMAGYYRRFVPNFADLSAPLTDLISPKKKFIWTLQCQDAFIKIRALLINAPILRSPQYDQPFILHVDASEVGAGAVLLQNSSQGILHPICYASTKFKSYQRNYSTIEKECCALVFAFTKFSVYLNGNFHPIDVYTDHNPLKFLHRMKNSNQRLMRWALALQQYKINIFHIKGKDNVLADMLSRI